MNLSELHKVAEAMVAPGRGILAVDESTGTISKRFDALGVKSTPDNRRDYREMLFRRGLLINDPTSLLRFVRYFMASRWRRPGRTYGGKTPHCLKGVERCSNSRDGQPRLRPPLACPPYLAWR